MASYEPKQPAVATSTEWKQSWSAPKAAPGNEEPWTTETPIWHVVVRGFQIFFGLIIAGLAGVLIHGHLMNAVAFGLVCSLFTWIICIWSLVSEKILSARKAYNIWATLSLDFFMIILWLASMGANAANRAAFRFDVNVEGCYDDGSSISANTCIVNKRELVKRFAVASKGGLAMMSGIAGLSALQMLLFVATFAYNAHKFRLYYQATKGPKTTQNGALEMNAQHTPMLSVQQGGPVPPAYPQYTDQQAYQPQVPVQQPVEQYQPTPTTSPAPAPAQMPTPSPQPYPYGHAEQQYPGQQAPAQYAPAHHPPQQYAEAPGHTPSQGHTPAQYLQTTQSYNSNAHEMPSHSQGYPQPTSFSQ
ncbi:hypothetical protein N0V85_000729 [Neurospora sp. IMI 360204]|nr:hypothetical protein N0V85_000729 [Neurospora sp. IMI 360204]